MGDASEGCSAGVPGEDQKWGCCHPRRGWAVAPNAQGVPGSSQMDGCARACSVEPSSAWEGEVVFGFNLVFRQEKNGPVSKRDLLIVPVPR